MTSLEVGTDERHAANEGSACDALVRGLLTPLRTKAEVQASTETTFAFIVEVPNVSASKLLDLLRDVVPAEVTAALQHLRRFAKPEFLPHHLSCGNNNDEPGSDVVESDQRVESTRQARSTTSHVLVCPTHAVAYDILAELFMEHIELFKGIKPLVRQTKVPVFAPTSAVQAAEWSTKYWPTIYKNTNPYGPHPAMVRRAELELLADDDAHRYMSIARKAAEATSCKKIGLPVGVVIVERVSNVKGTRIVSVAGDASYLGVMNKDAVLKKNDQPEQHNILGHAALRAIAMVAQKRRILAELTEADSSIRDIHTGTAPSDTSLEPDNPAFSGIALTDIEQQYCTTVDNLSPNGYLCLDLEIYLTHEPCVMCAMAILHSRLARVVFGKRMPQTGALCAEEDSLGQGLFWRDQLNWKFLAWQWTTQSSDRQHESESNENFHA